MDRKTFGALAAAAVASFISGATVGCERNPLAKAPPNDKLVKCYSRTCAGKVEYQGKRNSCHGMARALEIPENACNPNKGLKIITEG